MTTRNKHKTLRKKTQSFNRSIADFALFRALAKNKRAVSAVISNLILIGAVLAIGLVALGYARSTSINYQTEYAQTMNSDINKIKESLTFEYAHYSSNQLTMYVMNSGPVNVTIKSISINSSPVSSSSLTIYRMSDNQQIINNVIAKGTEVKIVLDTSGMTHSGENSVKITSRSDSNFAYNFFV
jgi:hypothetical protein